MFAGVGWRCSKEATCIYNVFKLPPKTLGLSQWFWCRAPSPDQGKLTPALGSWKKPQSSFKLLLNIYKYHFSSLNQGPNVQIYKFWGLKRPIKWVLGLFTEIPVWGSIHPGPFAQGPMNHALPGTWALAERFNHWVKSANCRKRVDE